MTLTIGSVCSGVGGLELGLERAGLGPVVWQIEHDQAARLVLQHHWPEVKRYEYVERAGRTNLAPVELVCGGFPCQDVSSAGARAGLAGAQSGLWCEFKRIIAELRPAWVVVENVASGAHLWVDAVARDLEELGYACLPIPLAASDVGAPHRRPRVFIIGAAPHAHAQGQPRQAPIAGWDADGRRWTGDGAAGHWAHEPALARVVHGLSGRVDRERFLANAVVPQCAEVVGWVIRELCAAEAAA